LSSATVFTKSFPMGRDDGLDNLLSNIGGIDSSRFRKPPGMKDQGTEGFPAKESTGTGSKSQSSSYKHPAAVISPRLQPSVSQGDSNSKLDSLLGDTLFSKASRCSNTPRAWWNSLCWWMSRSQSAYIHCIDHWLA